MTNRNIGIAICERLIQWCAPNFAPISSFTFFKFCFISCMVNNLSSDIFILKFRFCEKCSLLLLFLFLIFSLCYLLDNPFLQQQSSQKIPEIILHFIFNHFCCLFSYFPIIMFIFVVIFIWLLISHANKSLLVCTFARLLRSKLSSFYHFFCSSNKDDAFSHFLRNVQQCSVGTNPTIKWQNDWQAKT